MVTKTIGNFTFNYEHVNKQSKHYVTMKHNGYYVSDGIYRWLNRTWEKYTYQKAMISAARNYMNQFEVEITEEYKRTHGVQRLTKKVKEQLQELFDQDKRIQEVKILIDKLKNNTYGL